MNKKGHYSGGHTLLGPNSSDWFSNAEQAKKQEELLRSGKCAHGALKAKATAKAASERQAVQQRLERLAAKQKARLEARRGEMKTRAKNSSSWRMENVVVVRKRKSCD